MSYDYSQDDPTHKSRDEDAIIAYTWYHYIMNTSDPEYLLRLPMTKVREFLTTRDSTYLTRIPDSHFSYSQNTSMLSLPFSVTYEQCHTQNAFAASRNAGWLVGLPSTTFSGHSILHKSNGNCVS